MHTNATTTTPLAHDTARGETRYDENAGNLKNYATGPDTKTGTTAQTNPTIVNPPSLGVPALTSANTPATQGNVPTSHHPTAAGPHPPIDATHHSEKVVPVPISTSQPTTNRLRKLEKGNLTDLANILLNSYSSAEAFMILPTTEIDVPHSVDNQQHVKAPTGDDKLAQELKKDQAQIDKLNHRRDYIFRKIARTLLKRGGAWGLYDQSSTHLVAAALLVPPVSSANQNESQLRLEDPKINEGQANHYVPLTKIFTKKNPKQLVLLGPSLIKRIRLELRLFDTAMTIHQRPDVAFLYFFGEQHGNHTVDHKTHADQALIQEQNPVPVLNHQSHGEADVLLRELGLRFPMQVTAQRYRDNTRFNLLLHNGFQEIDKVQGFHQRGGEAEAHVVAPGIGSKEIAHPKESTNLLYESCFIALAKGIYPSLKNVENDVRGIVPQKQTQGIISDPTTVLPPAHVPVKNPDSVHTSSTAHTTAPSHS